MSLARLGFGEEGITLTGFGLDVEDVLYICNQSTPPGNEFPVLLLPFQQQGPFMLGGRPFQMPIQILSEEECSAKLWTPLRFINETL